MGGNLHEAVLICYLDPGSGSALVGTLIAMASVLLYSVRSLFYRLVKGSAFSSEQLDESSVVLLSEGKTYWGTFRPIVVELLRRKVPFRYYTLDLLDPALEIEDPLMYARLYDKNSVATFVKLAKLKAPVMLATTPNIGSPGYPLKRPAGVGKLVHVFHAFADISAYHQGSLDHYDAVIMVGDHQIAPIRQVESARGLAPKELVALGLPYIDDQWEKLVASKACQEKAFKEPGTVLVAPSWGAKGCLREYGVNFIKQIAAAGYNIILRPHPQSYATEPDLIAACVKATADDARTRWDTATIGDEAMAASDILVSDTSSIRFDYAFLYGKPVITLEIPRESQDAYESVYMDKIWTDAAGHRIGRVIGKDRIEELARVIGEVLSAAPTQALENYRGEIIRNFGTSAVAIVDFLMQKRREVLASGGMADV